MRIADLITKRLREVGQGQKSAARDLGVSRQTFINWMKGVYVPDPWPEEQVKRLADWLGHPYPLVLAMIFREKGIDPDVLPAVASAVAKKPFSAAMGRSAYLALGVAA